MKIHIVMEHADGMGATPNNMDDIILGVFFDQRRAEDFVRGIISYVSSYENRRLFLDEGKAIDENDTIHFQIVSRDIV